MSSFAVSFALRRLRLDVVDIGVSLSSPARGVSARSSRLSFDRFDLAEVAEEEGPPQADVAAEAEAEVGRVDRESWSEGDGSVRRGDDGSRSDFVPAEDGGGARLLDLRSFGRLDVCMGESGPLLCPFSKLPLSPILVFS